MDNMGNNNDELTSLLSSVAAHKLPPPMERTIMDGGKCNEVIFCNAKRRKVNTLISIFEQKVDFQMRRLPYGPPSSSSWGAHTEGGVVGQ